MNSYPLEFLAHPQPLMFVAGLSDDSGSSSTTRNRSSSVISTSSVKTASRRPSHGAHSLDPQTAAGTAALNLTSPLTSPGPSSNQLPQSPPSDELSEQALPLQNTDRDKELEGLISNLRDALKEHGERGKMWMSGPERKSFRILLVDKNIRLPLRKIAPPAGGNDTTPHSPLSPLIPSSPLYPDGLVAPVWVRKHAELIPSVFVLFLRLYEAPSGPDSEPKEERDAREKRNKEKEREMDEALIQEIGDRRKRLGERGIKLTVVLMASAATLDSPSLDPRLSHLRRASQLSAKASLFVLTPVPADQLPDFVQSLQDALLESALDFYSSHAKRVRRKRARLPTGQFAVSQASSSAEKGRALGIQGWGVRYDWKSGWFAELRGEYDIARRHYEDCWNELAKMFTSTQILPPRTKRWAEAKVLADCVAIRICRLLLYEGDGARVTVPFFVHVKRFSDLSRGWGIGEETFEYWSWIARQYRILAELLEMALKSGLQLPPLPLPVFPTSGPVTGPPTPEHWSTPISSTNPIQSLQQPAFYFYTAATCSVQRQKRYQEALEAEQDALGSEAGAASGYVSTAPGFANEKKVDHAGLVIELFTKAYSLLKEQEYSRDHAALYVAYRIAETYCSSGQHEMAMKFFDRIAESFTAKKWLPIVREIRKLWYECAQVTGSVDVAARLLIEMMCPQSGVDGEERAGLQDDLLTLLKTTTPSSRSPIEVDLSLDPLLSVQAGFWDPTTTLPALAPFQLVVASRKDVDISSLNFSEMHIAFTDDRPDVVIAATGAVVDDEAVDLGTVGRDVFTAALQWRPGSRLIMTGSLEGKRDTELEVAGITLRLTEALWTIDLKLGTAALQEWTTSKGPLTVLSGLSQMTTFVSPPHAVKLSLKNQSSAYINETVFITANVTNEDKRSMGMKMMVLLQASGEEDDDTTITVDDQSSNVTIEDIDLGRVEPGNKSEKTVSLRSSTPGAKVVEVVLRSKIDDGDEQETEQTVVLPIVEPFAATSTVTYQHVEQQEGMATVKTTLRLAGPRPLRVYSLTLKPNGEKEAEHINDSMSGTQVPNEWEIGTLFTIFSRFRVRSAPTLDESNLPKAPASVVVQWSSLDDASDKRVETRLELPHLVLPIQESFVSASISSPSVVSLDQAFALNLDLVNSHPTSPSVLSVEVSTAEAFVWRGDRIGRVDIPAGESQVIKVQLVPVGMMGWALLPKITVWEEKSHGDDSRREVRVKARDGGRVYIRP